MTFQCAKITACAGLVLTLAIFGSAKSLTDDQLELSDENPSERQFGFGLGGLGLYGLGGYGLGYGGLGYGGLGYGGLGLYGLGYGGLGYGGLGYGGLFFDEDEDEAEADKKMVNPNQKDKNVKIQHSGKKEINRKKTVKLNNEDDKSQNTRALINLRPFRGI